MKKNKIYMQEWLNYHSYQRSTASDQWYLQLSEKLLAQIEAEATLQELSTELKKELALSLAVYLEDSVSEGGGWSRFKAELKRLYNKDLPFYYLDVAKYYPDEINVEDIQFILWCVLTQDSLLYEELSFIDPHGVDLREVAQRLYVVLDKEFENVPITEGLSQDWIMELEQLQKKRRDLPTTSLEKSSSENSKKFLTYTKGEPLQFFATYDDLKQFFINVLGWGTEESGLMPEMANFSNFVLYANAKGMLMAPDVAPYFNAPHNPLFNEDKAKIEGFSLFCDEAFCPFDLIKYGMEHDLFSSVELPIAEGKKVLHENWDFIARWYLGEYYEGD